MNYLYLSIYNLQFTTNLVKNKIYFIVITIIYFILFTTLYNQFR